MIVEITENGGLDFDSPNYDRLKEGIVIFPESIEDIDKLNLLKELLLPLNK